MCCSSAAVGVHMAVCVAIALNAKAERTTCVVAAGARNLSCWKAGGRQSHAQSHQLPGGSGEGGGEGGVGVSQCGGVRRKSGGEGGFLQPPPKEVCSYPYLHCAGASQRDVASVPLGCFHSCRS